MPWTAGAAGGEQKSWEGAVGTARAAHMGWLPQKHPWELIPLQKHHGPYAGLVAQTLSVLLVHLTLCWDGFFWYLEGFSSFKWEPGSCPLLLPPVILELRIADDDFVVVFVEAGVEVEGNIIPSLEIQCKPAKTKMELLLVPQKPWTLLQSFPKTAERKPCWATTGHLHIYLV